MLSILKLLFCKRSKIDTQNYSPDTFHRDQVFKHSSNDKLFLQNECIVVHTRIHIQEDGTRNNSIQKCYQQEDHRSTCEDILQANQVLQCNSIEDRTFYFNELPFQIEYSDLRRSIQEEVVEFQQKFSSAQTDIRILVSKNVIVYVLGTNHANIQCKDDVVHIIQMLKPQTVFVELCSLRACTCGKHRNNPFQSTPKFTFRYLRSVITQLGFFPAMIFFTDVFREHLVSESSLLQYGGEFIAAITTAKSIDNCRIIFADRPIEITLKRQASAMDNWRGLRITLQVTLALLFKHRMKQLMVNANRLVFDDPKTYDVLVFERDLYLTYKLQKAVENYEKANNTNTLTRMVAVIGQGHMQGVQSYWGKVRSDFIPFIMSPQTIFDQ